MDAQGMPLFVSRQLSDEEQHLALLEGSHRQREGLAPRLVAGLASAEQLDVDAALDQLSGRAEAQVPPAQALRQVGGFVARRTAE